MNKFEKKLKTKLQPCTSFNTIEGTFGRFLIFKVPPMALMDAQVVILYFFRIDIVNFNKVMSKNSNGILIQ